MKKMRYGPATFMAIGVGVVVVYLLVSCWQSEATGTPPTAPTTTIIEDHAQVPVTLPTESTSPQPAESSILVTLNTPSTILRTVEFPSNCHYRSLSESNEWVVCSDNGLWVQHIGEEEWIQITTEEEDFSLAEWSPDGTMLAVTGWREPIWLYETDNWNERVMIYNNNSEHHGGVSWSSDGRYLITEEPMGGLILIHADGSGGEQLLEDGTVGNPMFGLARWSLDGQEVIYWTTPGVDYLDRGQTDFELWGIDIETRERQFLHRPALRWGESFFTWSPDGQQMARLLFPIPGGQGTFSIELLNLATMEARIIELPETLLDVDFHLAWSPDGSRIAMVASSYEGVTRDADIWLLSVETGEAHRYTYTEDYLGIIRWGEGGIVAWVSSPETLVGILEFIVVEE